MTYLNEYFLLNEKLLEVTWLVYPEKIKTLKDATSIGKIIIIVLFLICCDLDKIIYTIEHLHDFLFTVDNMRHVFFQVMTIFKIINFCLNRTKIKQIYSELEHEKLEYKIVPGVFEPNVIIDKSKKRNKILISLYIINVITAIGFIFIPKFLKVFITGGK